MQHHGEVLAILAGIALYAVRLIGINKQALAGAQFEFPAVHLVAYAALAHADEFQIVVPVTEDAAIGIIAQAHPGSEHGKARTIVAHALGTIAHHIQGVSHDFSPFVSLFYHYLRYIPKYSLIYFGIFLV